MNAILFIWFLFAALFVFNWFRGYKQDGKLCCFSNSTSTSSTPVSNQQVAAEHGAAIGAYSSGNVISYSDASPDAIALAAHSVDTTTATQQQALESNTAALLAASAVVNHAIDSNSGVVVTALQSNQSAVHDALTAATTTIAASESAFANLSAQAIQSALQIAGNAAPQSPGATQEILQGTPPVQGTVATSPGATEPASVANNKTLEEMLLIVAVLFGAWILTKHSRS